MDALSNIDILERIVLSLVAGIIIGLEREWSAKPAGLRTYSLVCDGSAIFMIVGIKLAEEFAGTGAGSDPSRIASTVVQGVGFLAGGVIFTRGAHVKGMTTAAGIWVTAALGLLIGAGFFVIAFMGLAAAIFVLVPLRWLERDVLKPELRGNSIEASDGRHNGDSTDSATD